MASSAAGRFLPYSVAIVTPFTAAGTLDVASVPAVVKYYLDQNIPGLLVSGTTGEQHCMTIEERKQLYKAVAQTAAGQCELYAGVAAFKTDDAKELAQAAADAGFTGIMLGFPPYRIPTQQEAEEYVAQVAACAKELPIFLYNNPRRNGFSVEPATFARIAASVSNVLGQKEAGFPENVHKMKASLGDRVGEYSFLSGSDSSFIDAYTKHGYTGITSIAGNVYPEQVQRMVDHLRRGETEKAKQVMADMAPGIALLEKAGMIQSVKYILRKKGVPVGYCPPPIQDVSDATKQTLDMIFFP